MVTLASKSRRLSVSRGWGSHQGWSCGLNAAGLLRALGVPKITREAVWRGENRGPGAEQQRMGSTKRDGDGAARGTPAECAVTEARV